MWRGKREMWGGVWRAEGVEVEVHMGRERGRWNKYDKVQETKSFGFPQQQSTPPLQACYPEETDAIINLELLLLFPNPTSSANNPLRHLGKQLLVPLTPSLYVPGTLASTETVLVDVGTGFYVEKVCLAPPFSSFPFPHLRKSRRPPQRASSTSRKSRNWARTSGSWRRSCSRRTGI